MTLHEERLDHTLAVLRTLGARRLLDLGCGAGALLCRVMLEPQFDEVVGLESSGESLVQARANLAQHLSASPARLRLVHGSYAQHDPQLVGFDAAVMLETIEHVPPQALSTVETAVFGHYRPRNLFMTTPNREYNGLLGLAPNQFRDEDHKFEWSRAKFRHWGSGVARRNDYRVVFGGIGDRDPDVGTPTQTALFSRVDVA